MVAAAGESNFFFGGPLEGSICTDWWSHSHARMGNTNWGQTIISNKEENLLQRREMCWGEGMGR